MEVDESKVDEDLQDFPVLVHLSASSGTNSKDVTDVFDELAGNRKKIAVTTANGTTECDVEIEQWLGESRIDLESSSSSSISQSSSSSSSTFSGDSREAWLWVKVPHVDKEDGGILYLYYDNNHADNTGHIGDMGSDPGQSVWDSNFISVWHISGGGASGTRVDSTSNDWHLITQNYEGTEAIQGKIAGADDMAVDDNLYAPNSASHLTSGTGTISAWVWSNSDNNQQDRFFSYYDASASTTTDHFLAFRNLNDALGDDVIEARVKYDGVQYWRCRTDANFMDTRRAQWIHVVLLQDGVEPKLYVDGENVTLTFDPAPTDKKKWWDDMQGASKADTLYIAGALDGRIDEYRVSDIARSAAWIKAEYNSGNDSLLSFGDTEDLSSSSSTT